MAYREFIDLSHHNTALNWHGLDQRYEAVIIRASDGKMRDRMVQQHMDSAIDHNRRIGLYHRVSPYVPGSRQLETFLAAIDAVDYGDPGDILPVLDLEDDPSPTQAFRPVDYCLTVLNLMAALDQEWGGCILYFSRGFWVKCGSPPEWLTRPVWAAWYPSRDPLPADEPFAFDAFRGSKSLVPTWDAWQYGQRVLPTFSRSLKGIDVNITPSWDNLVLKE